jgi:hypothetical protein
MRDRLRPPGVVHLITRAQGGLHDYQAFLHEAGHALHYAGLDAELPLTFRRLARDHALTEIYSYISRRSHASRGWHAEHFGLTDDEAQTNAEATTFLEALLFRRYTANLQSSSSSLGPLRRRRRLARGILGAADGGDRASVPALELPLRHGTGLLLRRYLRAWIRSAQLRAHLVAEVGEDWWRRPETGERLRALFREGTRPSSEDVAARIGVRSARHRAAPARARRLAPACRAGPLIRACRGSP